MPAVTKYPKEKARYWELRRQGWGTTSASREVGVSRKTAYNWEHGSNIEVAPSAGRDYETKREDGVAPEPRTRHWLEDHAPEAAKALDDFAYFRDRYLGRRSSPWQEEAGQSVAEWLTSPTTEFVLVNCPPGSGKSTLFAHDIIAWLICRDRTIRIIIGSSTFRLAEKYSERVQKLLERVRPLGVNPRQGRDHAASGCLAVDYGRFKPDAATGIWRKHEFVVAQLDDDTSEEKEPTVAAYGQDSEFLGSRADLVVWDDLVTDKLLRNSENIEGQRKWWIEEGETRVEPGGLCLVQGQRRGPDDLYAYCRDMKVSDEEGAGPKYRHILYPAHFDDRCTKDHTRPDVGYPTGCLLDPIRLPWLGSGGLATIQTNSEKKYQVEYQQGDLDPTSVLVPMIYVSGGTVDGITYPGCWDNDRDLCEIPQGLTAPLFSIATADPSPTKYWAVEWWAYHPDSKQRFLLDLYRGAMDAPDFLDWSANQGIHIGLMDEWQKRSVQLGLPITHWIIENNAAQRWLLQYDHTRRWMRKHGVLIQPHSTTLNKLDPNYGIEMLKNVYKYGQVRLPGKQKTGARLASLRLVDEVTRYPLSRTDDCMMAEWFFEYHLPKITAVQTEIPELKRPSWVKTLLRTS